MAAADLRGSRAGKSHWSRATAVDGKRPNRTRTQSEEIRATRSQVDEWQTAPIRAQRCPLLPPPRSHHLQRDDRLLWISDAARQPRASCRAAASPSGYRATGPLRQSRLRGDEECALHERSAGHLGESIEHPFSPPSINLPLDHRSFLLIPACAACSCYPASCSSKRRRQHERFGGEPLGTYSPMLVWILLIVIIVLLLTGGGYYRRRRGS